MDNTLDHTTRLLMDVKVEHSLGVTSRACSPRFREFLVRLQRRVHYKFF